MTIEKGKKKNKKLTKKMEVADKYFDCTDGERIAFELGIKLGALFHQFVGAPVSSHNIETLERAIEETTESQAFVRSAKVNIRLDDEEIGEKSPFDYTTLTEEMIEVEVVVEYGDLRAVGMIEYIEDMNYPLMYIREIG